MYNHKEIEKKWNEKWYEANLYRAEDFSDKPKKYILVEFPYPSGTNLHCGHLMRYNVPDTYARKLRMEGYNVLFPMGWDAFGLPAENYAVKTGVHPSITTEKAIQSFKKLMREIGFGFDWSREINTTDPEYYKWTQWLFLKFWENGLAELKEESIWWSDKLKTVLANEEVIKDADGNLVAERDGSPVERRMLKQWVLKMPQYADKLIEGLHEVDFSDAVKSMQINWIGRSEGAEVDFEIAKKNEKIRIFTTRLDTIYGATFLVLAPEHERVNALVTEDKKIEVEAYKQSAKNKSDLERTQLQKEKTGVFTGSYAVNPFNGKQIPIWISDFVVTGYGTGAIMAVPAHDERDNEFAKKFNLEIIPVIEPITGEEKPNEEFRRSIVAIVRDPKTNKVLSINWGDKLGGNLFIGGGVEGNEDIIECAIREIQEETGYKNVELKEISEKVHHHYFAASKNVARNIEATGLYFELKNDEQVSTQLEENEKNKFTVEWLSIEEAERKVTDHLHKYLFDKFVLGKINSEKGILCNSEEYSGMISQEAFEKMLKDKSDVTTKKVNFKLRDWLFSRQRYWGEPIPLIHKANGQVEAICDTNNSVEVQQKLPLVLPEVPDYTPSSDALSPLAKNEDWVNTTDKKGNPAKRETNTMPNWAGSCWYYLRYIDPKNNEAFVDFEKMQYWLPVDRYFGGSEHTTLHLLYSRFWHKFFFDLGLVPTSEPYQWRMNGGLLLGPDGEKMSKSKGNIIPADEKIEMYGADALRLYINFMGPYDATISWLEGGLKACKRLVDDIVKLSENISDKENNKGFIVVHNKAIKNVSEMIDSLKTNTAVSELMIWVNAAKKESSINTEIWKDFLKLLAPFAPFLTEELWQEINKGVEWSAETSIHKQKWPTYNPELVKDETITIAVQINGKVRANIEISPEESEESVKEKTLAKDEVQKWLEGKEVKKFIYVKGRIVNIVV